MDLRGSNGEKERGQLRFCCDFRYLNAVTIKDAYPIPRIDESLSKLGDAKFFTTLDLGSAFWQVPLRKKDREKTGFACELGLYQWKRMPFGLCNATATFQRLMAQDLTRVTKKYGDLVMCYVDDVVIAIPTLEDHIDQLDEVFGCMNRSSETFLTRLSRTNERSEKSRRVFKKPRCYKDESDDCIDTWIDVMKLHFEEDDLSERQECSALTSNLEGTALNCVMAKKQYQRDPAEKICEIFLNRF